MFANLAKPDDDIELHWLKDGKMRCTTGSVVSSLYHLNNTENRNEDAGFFVFPDLSVRTDDSYCIKLSLFEVVGYVPSLFTPPDWLAPPSPEIPSAVANPSTVPPCMYTRARSSQAWGVHPPFF
ncbi:hypothetical protein ID866_11281 [Astraeus odoratus]|nr:hypothetical protein ID866_11281 [Astraeus odoratus]